MNLIKKILLATSIFILLVVLMNFDFFWQNIRYSFVKPKNSAAIDQQKTMEPNFLVIDSLGLKAPIVYAEEKSETVYQEALKKGVVHFPETAAVGELGNCYIFGHSSDYVWSGGKYKTVFALLPRISIGVHILVSNDQGKIFDYVVTNAFVAGANDVQYLDQQNNKQHLLTLQTSYPLGTALKRFIVQAKLQ